jgi:predicted PurR-regulated permease PerM
VQPLSELPLTVEEHEAVPGGPLTPGRLLLTLVAVYFVINVPLVIEVLLLALLYATLIEGPILRMERWRIPRGAAVIVFDLVVVGSIVAAVALAAPAMAREIHQLRQEEPARLRELSANWAQSNNSLLRGPGRHALERVIPIIEEPDVPPEAALVAAKRVVGGIVGLLAFLVLAYYYLTEKAMLRAMVLEAVSRPSEARVRRLWDEVERSVGGWLRGRLLLGLIVGIITMPVFGLMHLPYWPLLGLIAGLAEPIPILGPWIGGAPAALLALTKSAPLAIVVVLFVLLRQGIVDAVLVPRVMKRTIGLSPLAVFVAVITGTRLAGPIGALLAIPIAAAIQVIIADVLAVRRAEGHMIPRSGWRWLRDRSA